MRATLFIILTQLMIGGFAYADTNSDLDSLGGNRELIRRAKAINPKNQVQVVQNRTVDRHSRLEIGVNYGTIAGGDPYVKTNNLGAHLDFHFTPHWSLGARYYSSSNALSSEGKRLAEEAEAARADQRDQSFPKINYVSDTYLGVVNWYPMYGKLNLFDWSIAQFDVYLLAGAGQVHLNTGWAPAYTAGGGLALWLSQHISTRFEARYQTYNDQIESGARHLDQTILSATLGILL